MNSIIVTIIAAFFQNLRSSFQKKINKDVSTIASTYVRFSFALPLALLLFFVYFREFAIIKEINLQDIGFNQISGTNLYTYQSAEYKILNYSIKPK